MNAIKTIIEKASALNKTVVLPEWLSLTLMSPRTSSIREPPCLP